MNVAVHVWLESFHKLKSNFETSAYMPEYEKHEIIYAYIVLDLLLSTTRVADVCASGYINCLCYISQLIKNQKLNRHRLRLTVASSAHAQWQRLSARMTSKLPETLKRRLIRGPGNVKRDAISGNVKCRVIGGGG